MWFMFGPSGLCWSIWFMLGPSGLCLVHLVHAGPFGLCLVNLVHVRSIEFMFGQVHVWSNWLMFG